MLRSSLFSASAFALLCVTASAQSSLTPQKITAPIKDRGTYHMATGTWTRANPSTNFSTDVLFNNTAQTGYFFGTTSTWATIDHGRIPSTSSPLNGDSVTGNADAYTIDCFQIGYCSNQPGSVTSMAMDFYENYGPCSDVDNVTHPAPVAGFTASGLPGGDPMSGQGCWVVTFDLSNSTATFNLGGDADGTWDNLANADSFGWSLAFPSATGSNGTGPFISGNCPNLPGGVTAPQRGFGTKFGGVNGATDATGLGTNDFFWIDGPGLPVANPNGGCFFFGGCTGNGVTGASHNPFGGYWLQLFGTKDTGGPPVGTPYCTSIVNASGSRAVMTHSGSDANADLAIHVTGMPNTSGRLFHGTMGAPGTGAAMLGDGPLCAVMSTVRLPIVTAGMMMQPANGINFVMSYTAPYASSLAGTRHFQLWFRSTLATGSGSNGSDGVSVTF